MGELGLFGITVPAENGGVGLDSYAYAIVMEELSRGYASVADQCGVVELIGTLLTQFGSAEQQRAMASQAIAAPKTIVSLLHLRGRGRFGCRPASRRRRARTAGGWRLNGAKTWIHNAPVADVGFVLARTDPAAGHRGMANLHRPLRQPGVARGPKEHKMGQRASQVGALNLR